MSKYYTFEVDTSWDMNQIISFMIPYWYDKEQIYLKFIYAYDSSLILVHTNIYS